MEDGDEALDSWRNWTVEGIRMDLLNYLEGKRRIR